LAVKAEQQRQQAERVRLARERDPKYIAKVKSQQLRARYGLDLFIEKHCFGRLMEILRRADAGSRFQPEDLVWLSTEGKAYFSEPLKHKFHAAEADFFISEYQRTRDPWMAVSASGHCRKSGRASEAHDLLASIPQASQKLPKLRSAICTTHGGALRDLGLWDDALALGEQAHGLTPRDYRPCTLLGAVHMETGNYEAGQSWYAKAVERGAEERSIDADLRGIIMRADMAKREEIKRFLLRDDPVRFAWVSRLRS
jgi:tetratricopeptide (TPR) repeat protein